MPLDGQSAAPARARAGLVIGGFAGAIAFGVGALVLLARLDVSTTWLDGGYWALGIAVAALLAAGAAMHRNSTVSPVLGGLALATDTISAAFFLALAGAIFAWGHDGLAFALGLGAGCLFLQLVVAPRLPLTGAASLPEVFSARYPGRAPTILCAAVILISMLTLLVAELMAAGLIGARLLGVEFATATLIAAFAVFACFIVRNAGGTAWVNGLLFPFLLVAVLVPLVQLSAQWYGLPVPQLAYANALWQIQGLEETLLEQDLADPAVMRPMLSAFVQLTPINFMGIVLGLAAGVASLPSLLSHFTSKPVRTARWSAVWGLIFVALFLTLAPAVAAYAKLSFITLISDRTPLANLPAWIFIYGKLGLVEVCGRAATDTAAIAKACAELPDASPVLRLQDITLSPDMILLALPDIAGLDHAVLGAIAAAGLAVALVTAHGPLSAIVRALGFDGGATPSDARPRASRLVAYGVAGVTLIAAAFAALTRPATILDVATWALTLAAAGLFPALFAALWWKRANAIGAAAGMAIGLAAALVYLIGTRYFAVPFFEAFSALSSAGPTGQEVFGELKAAWLAAGPGPAKDVAWAALDTHAQTIADWWGINGLATALLALPAGVVTLVVISLVTPAPRIPETAP